MKTQIELAGEGIITEQMQMVAADEKIDPETIRDRVAKGQIVIPNNPFRKGQKVVGIGRGLSTKVNASIVKRHLLALACVLTALRSST